MIRAVGAHWGIRAEMHNWPTVCVEPCSSATENAGRGPTTRPSTSRVECNRGLSHIVSQQLNAGVEGKADLQVPRGEGALPQRDNTMLNRGE